LHPDHARREATRRKYDAIAPDYSSRYANPTAVATRQVKMIRRWGAPLEPGASVLEVGCADGLVTEALAAAGFVVTAVDLSPVMVERAQERVRAAGLRATLLVGDIDTLELGKRFDAVLGVMWTFFAYASDPQRTLTRLAGHSKTKLLVDFNPRTIPLSSAIATVHAAGFSNISWRPFLVPQRHRLPAVALAGLEAAELVPGIRRIPLGLRGNAVIKAELSGQR